MIPDRLESLELLPRWKHPLGEVLATAEGKAGRPLQLTVLRRELVRGEPAVRRCVDTHAMLAEMECPYLPALVEARRVADGRVVLAMERLEGQPLGRLVLDGPMAPGRVIAILRQLCRALDVAHGLGVRHGALSVASVILVEHEGRPDAVRLVDFGLEDELTVEAMGAHEVAMQPLSPEKVAGRVGDAREDVYLLGVVGYAALAGRLPFTGEPAAVRSGHALDIPEPLDCEPPLADVIGRCLEKDPAKRFADVRALDDALIGAQELLGVTTAWDDLRPLGGSSSSSAHGNKPKPLGLGGLGRIPLGPYGLVGGDKGKGGATPAERSKAAERKSGPVPAGGKTRATLAERLAAERKADAGEGKAAMTPAEKLAEKLKAERRAQAEKKAEGEKTVEPEKKVEAEKKAEPEKKAAAEKKLELKQVEPEKKLDSRHISPSASATFDATELLEDLQPGESGTFAAPPPPPPTKRKDETSGSRPGRMTPIPSAAPVLVPPTVNAPAAKLDGTPIAIAKDDSKPVVLPKPSTLATKADGKPITLPKVEGKPLVAPKVELPFAKLDDKPALPRVDAKPIAIPRDDSRPIELPKPPGLLARDDSRPIALPRPGGPFGREDSQPFALPRPVAKDDSRPIVVPRPIARDESKPIELPKPPGLVAKDESKPIVLPKPSGEPVAVAEPQAAAVVASEPEPAAPSIAAVASNASTPLDAIGAIEPPAVERPAALRVEAQADAAVSMSLDAVSEPETPWTNAVEPSRAIMAPRPDVEDGQDRDETKRKLPVWLVAAGLTLLVGVPTAWLATRDDQPTAQATIEGKPLTSEPKAASAGEPTPSEVTPKTPLAAEPDAAPPLPEPTPTVDATPSAEAQTADAVADPKLAQPATADSAQIAQSAPAPAPAASKPKSSSAPPRPVTSSAGPTPQEKARELIRAGDKLYASGQAAKAKSKYKAALAEHSRAHAASAGLGKIAFNEAAYADAAAHYGRAVKASASNGEYRILYGDALFKLGKLAEAKEQYAKAKSLGNRQADGRLKKVQSKLGR